MYCTINYKSKKALKDAVNAGVKPSVFQPNDIFGNPKASPDYSGTVCLSGPHYPEPHRWYATVTIVAGVITKVK